MDECQISSSEYIIIVKSNYNGVLDECQISSSEYKDKFNAAVTLVLDECQISSSEYPPGLVKNVSYSLG